MGGAGGARRYLYPKRLRAQLRREPLTEEDRQILADLEELRPRVRADCARVPRPCPFVSCKFNLYLDVKANGSLVLNFPNHEPWELKHSCALDIAETVGEKPLTMVIVGRALNVTDEQIRQIQEAGLRHLRAALEARHG